MIALTRHAKEKALRLYAMTPDILEEMAGKAILEGYSFNDAPSKKLARWLRGKARTCNAYVYSGYAFIMQLRGECLIVITTYRVPHHLLMSLPRSKTYIGR